MRANRLTTPSPRPPASYFPPVLMTSPPQRRDSIGPELIYEQTAAEDEPLASEDDVKDVEDDDVERKSDTDPPPPVGDEDR